MSTARPPDGRAGAVPSPSWLGARRVVPAALTVLGVAALVLAVAGVRDGVGGDVRTLVTVVFLVLGPGWAAAAFLRTRSLAERLLLAAAVGLAVGILAGQAMVVSRLWHPAALLAVTVVATVPLLVGHAVRGR